MPYGIALEPQSAVRVEPGGALRCLQFFLRNQGENLGLGTGARSLIDHFAVLHDDERGDAHNAKLGCEFGLLINIDFADLQVCPLVCNLVDDGGYHAAWATPACPEIEEYGFAFL